MPDVDNAAQTVARPLKKTTGEAERGFYSLDHNKRPRLARELHSAAQGGPQNRFVGANGGFPFAVRRKVCAMHRETFATLFQHNKRGQAFSRRVPTVHLITEFTGQLAGDARPSRIGFRQGAQDRLSHGPKCPRLLRALLDLGAVFAFALGGGFRVGAREVRARDTGESVGVVIADGMNAGDILISEGLARRYPSGCEFWCRSCN